LRVGYAEKSNSRAGFLLARAFWVVAGFGFGGGFGCSDLDVGGAGSCGAGADSGGDGGDEACICVGIGASGPEGEETEGPVNSLRRAMSSSRVQVS